MSSSPAADRMDALLAQTRARLSAIAEIDRAVRESAADDGDTGEDFARRARSGELGRNWVVLQGRIDLGETTLTAVLDGSDTSAEAEAVRAASQANLARLREDERENAEREGRPDPVRELEQQRERLLGRAAALQARVARLAEEGRP